MGSPDSTSNLEAEKSSSPSPSIDNPSNFGIDSVRSPFSSFSSSSSSSSATTTITALDRYHQDSVPLSEILQQLGRFGVDLEASSFKCVPTKVFAPTLKQKQRAGSKPEELLDISLFTEQDGKIFVHFSDDMGGREEAAQAQAEAIQDFIRIGVPGSSVVIGEDQHCYEGNNDNRGTLITSSVKRHQDQYKIFFSRYVQWLSIPFRHIFTNNPDAEQQQKKSRTTPSHQFKSSTKIILFGEYQGQPYCVVVEHNFRFEPIEGAYPIYYGGQVITVYRTTDHIYIDGCYADNVGLLEDITNDRLLKPEEVAAARIAIINSNPEMNVKLNDEENTVGYNYLKRSGCYTPSSAWTVAQLKQEEDIFTAHIRKSLPEARKLAIDTAAFSLVEQGGKKYLLSKKSYSYCGTALGAVFAIYELGVGDSYYLAGVYATTVELKKNLGNYLFTVQEIFENSVQLLSPTQKLLLGILKSGTESQLQLESIRKSAQLLEPLIEPVLMDRDVISSASNLPTGITSVAQIVSSILAKQDQTRDVRSISSKCHYRTREIAGESYGIVTERDIVLGASTALALKDAEVVRIYRFINGEPKLQATYTSDPRIEELLRDPAGYIERAQAAPEAGLDINQIIADLRTQQGLITQPQFELFTEKAVTEGAAQNVLQSTSVVDPPFEVDVKTIEGKGYRAVVESNFRLKSTADGPEILFPNAEMVTIFKHQENGNYLFCGRYISDLRIKELVNNAIGYLAERAQQARTNEAIWAAAALNESEYAQAALSNIATYNGRINAYRGNNALINIAKILALAIEALGDDQKIKNYKVLICIQAQVIAIVECPLADSQQSGKIYQSSLDLINKSLEVLNRGADEAYSTTINQVLWILVALVLVALAVWILLHTGGVGFGFVMFTVEDINFALGPIVMATVGALGSSVGARYGWRSYKSLEAEREKNKQMTEVVGNFQEVVETINPTPLKL